MVFMVKGMLRVVETQLICEACGCCCWCCADVPLREDVADLKAGATEDVTTTDRDGGPVGVVEPTREEVEAQEAFVTPA